MLRATLSSAQHAIAKLHSRSCALKNPSHSIYVSNCPQKRFEAVTRRISTAHLCHSSPSWSNIDIQGFGQRKYAHGIRREFSADATVGHPPRAKKRWKEILDDYEKYTAKVFESNGQEIPRLRRRDFVTSQVVENDKKYWTATYHCPSSGRIIQSGTLASLDQVDPRKRAFLHTSKFEEIDPTKVFISSLSYAATHSKVKQFIENVLGSLDDVKDISIEPGRFKGYGFVQFNDAKTATNAMDKLNDKFLLKREIRASIGDRVDYKAFYKSRNIALEACVGRIIDSINVHNEDHTRLCKEEPEDYKVSPPQKIQRDFIDTLRDFYDRNDTPLTQEAWSFERMTVDSTGRHQTKWTASFTCPITETRVETGTLKPHLLSQVLGIDKSDVLLEDNKVLYPNKKSAYRACAATVVDSLSGNTDVWDMNHEPYCEENPIVDLSTLVAEQIGKDKESSGDEPKIIENKSDNRKKNQATKLKDPMSAILHLHRMYNPKDLRSSSVTSAITYCSSFLEKEDSKRIYWSAAFTSPVTAEVFRSGILKGEDSVRINNETFYNSKKSAKMAALGHAVDCFVHRGGWVNSESKQSLYRFQTDVSEQYVPFCVDVPQDSAQDIKVVIEEFIPPLQNKNSETKMTPKSVIYSRYQKLLREAIDKDCFENESVDVEIDGRIVPYWTSTFECPITGRIFPTGTLINVEKNNEPDSLPPLKIIDDIVYYSDKKTAEHACAGRTFDILSATNFFSSFGGSDYKILPQFCEESPHSYDEAEDDEDEDDFVIQEVPKVGKFNPDSNGNFTTMDVVLDIWADHGSFRNQPKESTSTADALSTALSWIEKMKSEATGSMTEDYSTSATLRQTVVSTFACNAILKALANMNANDTDDVEQLSGDIIKLMVDLSIGRNQNMPLPCEPDVATFNSYIRCMQSSNPIDSANRAENFLKDMLDGVTFEGYKLPKPDCDTFNAVMKHWQSIGSEDGHKNISTLFSRMELSMESISGLKPNKETFLIALKSLVHQKDASSGNHMFAMEEAHKWIELMEKFSTNFNYDDMIVDTEVYNAALPPLLRNDGLKNGELSKHFPSKLDEGDALRLNAANVEDWINSMNRMSRVDGKVFVAPDIKTYEAVIQAWIQNNSEEGLINAEKWIMKAIDAAVMDSGIHLRLEMFRSLMLAWACSGSKSGPTKIQGLIDRLNELSETFPELKADGEICSFLILAWRNYQLHCLDLPKGDNKIMRIERIGTDCIDHLSSIIENESLTEGMILGGNVFSIVLDILSDAARECSTPVLTLAPEMVRVIKMYNRYIDFCNTIYDDAEDESADDDESERQLWEEKCQKLGRIILDGDNIHANLMKSIISIAGENEASRNQVVEQHFHEIERFLLRRDKFRRLFYSKVSESHAVEPVPFPEALFHETLQWCKCLVCPTRNGDAVRVAMKVFNHVLNQFDDKTLSQTQAVDMYTRIIDVIDTVVSDETAKVLLLKRITTDIIASDPDNKSLASAIKPSLPDEININSAMVRKGKSKRKHRKNRKRLRRRKSSAK